MSSVKSLKIALFSAPDLSRPVKVPFITCPVALSASGDMGFSRSSGPADSRRWYCGTRPVQSGLPSERPASLIHNWNSILAYSVTRLPCPFATNPCLRASLGYAGTFCVIPFRLRMAQKFYRKRFVILTYKTKCFIMTVKNSVRSGHHEAKRFPTTGFFS